MYAVYACHHTFGFFVRTLLSNLAVNAVSSAVLWPVSSYRRLSLTTAFDLEGL